MLGASPEMLEDEVHPFDKQTTLAGKDPEDLALFSGRHSLFSRIIAGDDDHCIISANVHAIPRSKGRCFSTKAGTSGGACLTISKPASL
jgi:hypothetical protein